VCTVLLIIDLQWLRVTCLRLTLKTCLGAWCGYTSALKLCWNHELLFMCEKTVKRDIDMFNSTGLVTPTKQSTNPQRLLTEVEWTGNCSTVCVTPTWGMPTQSASVFFVQLETVYMFQPLICFPRQKIQVIALQQSAWSSWLKYLLLTLKHFFGLMNLVPYWRDCIGQYGY